MNRIVPSLLRAIVCVAACSASALATEYTVAPGGSDSAPGTAAAPFATIQKAVSVAGPGDTIVVKAGTYAGARMSTSGTSGSPIVLRGEPGAVVDAPGPQNSNGDNLWVRDAGYVVIEGFEVRDAPRAGIAVQAEADAESHGVVIRNNFCHDNGRWGIFTGYAEGVVITGNETSYSGEEHGIYVSNSSDNPVIRNNVAHHNNASGIQINADPALDGDGIISNAVVDSNVIYENGVAGGAAINLASVVRSRITNNLLYENHASGIVGWDDDDGDEFGTHDNLIACNTVAQAANGRFALSIAHGSTGNTVVDNILMHSGARGSIEIDSSSEPRLASDYNLLVDRFSFDEEFISAADWKARGHDAHSAVTSPSAVFVDAAAGDYRPRPGGPAVDAGTPAAGVDVDIANAPRPQGAAFDIGAYESGSDVVVPFDLAVDPPSRSVDRREKGQITVRVARTGGFTGPVTVTAPDTRALKIKLAPATATTSGGEVTFDFKVKKKARAGTYDLVFTGRDSSGNERSATLALTIR